MAPGIRSHNLLLHSMYNGWLKGAFWRPSNPKAGHSAEQKVINLLFLTSKDKLWALALTSEKWSVMREWGRFPLTHGQRISGRGEREREEFTENDHQKILPGVAAAKRLGLWFAFGTVYVPVLLHRSFLAGGGPPRGF